MKIAYIGTACTRTQAPFDDPDWQIWCQHNPIGIGRWDRWFEVHDLDAIPGAEGKMIRDYLFSLDGTRPVVMRQPHPRVLNSIAYPRDRIVARFGTEALTSTVSEAIALAIDEILPEKGVMAPPGQHAIGLWGCEMALEGEYAYQRAGCQQMLRIADALNIDIVLPASCDIMAPRPVYGIDAPTVLDRKLEAHMAHIARRQAEAIQRKTQAAQALALAETEISEYAGMLSFIKHEIDNGWGHL